MLRKTCMRIDAYSIHSYDDLVAMVVQPDHRRIQYWKWIQI